MKRTKCQMSYAMSLIISYSHSINLEQLLNQWTHGSALGVFESGHSISSLGAVELCTLSCCCNCCWRANLEFRTICSDLRSSSIFQERNTHQMTKLWIIYSIIKPVWFTDISMHFDVTSWSWWALLYKQTKSSCNLETLIPKW